MVEEPEENRMRARSRSQRLSYGSPEDLHADTSLSLQADSCWSLLDIMLLADFIGHHAAGPAAVHFSCEWRLQKLHRQNRRNKERNVISPLILLLKAAPENPVVDEPCLLGTHNETP